MSIALTDDESGFYDYFYADRMKYSIDQVTFSDGFLLNYVTPSQMSIRDVIKLVDNQTKLIEDLDVQNDLEEDFLNLNFSNSYLSYLYDKSKILDDISVLENVDYMYNLNLNYSPYEDMSAKRNYALFSLELYQKISLPLSVLFLFFGFWHGHVFK